MKLAVLNLDLNPKHNHDRHLTWGPVQAILHELACKIINDDKWRVLETSENRGEGVVPPFTLFQDVKTIAHSMSAHEGEQTTCSSSGRSVTDLLMIRDEDLHDIPHCAQSPVLPFLAVKSFSHPPSLLDVSSAGLESFLYNPRYLPVNQQG